MKKYNRYLIIPYIVAGLLALSFGAFALDAEPTLVFDTTGTGTGPKEYRSNAGLNISASGQFSAAELQQLLQSIPAPRQNIWIIDLRQESHGFINGMPITWFSDQNSANKNKTPLKIARDEKNLLHTIKQEKCVTVYNLKKLNAGKVTAINPVEIKVQSIESEQQLVTASGANYARFYVLDHNRPDDATVDQYVEFISGSLKSGDWMHFHCRGGKGRSSTFIAMYDMILHAKSQSFIEIMQHQVTMGNIKLDVTPTKAEKLWKTDSSKERYLFLQKFYSYAADPKGYPTRTWTEWLAAHSDKHAK